MPRIVKGPFSFVELPIAQLRLARRFSHCFFVITAKIADVVKARCIGGLRYGAVSVDQDRPRALHAKQIAILNGGHAELLDKQASEQTFADPTRLGKATDRQIFKIGLL